MKTQGVSLPHAVQILKQGAVLEGQRVGVARSHVRHLPSLVAGDATQADDQLVLAYLQGRGLGNGDLIDHFQLGYANKSLTYQLPPGHTQEVKARTPERLHRRAGGGHGGWSHPRTLRPGAAVLWQAHGAAQPHPGQSVAPPVPAAAPARGVERGGPGLALAQDCGALFLSDRGEPFKRVNLTAMVKKVIQKAQVNKPGSCHLFRHTMATLMLENGADIRFIQAMLGYAELSTTQIYTQVSIVKLKEIHTLTHPARLRRIHAEPVEALGKGAHRPRNQSRSPMTPMTP